MSRARDQANALMQRGDDGVLYTTWGPVCGGCGHAHRSIEAAERCLRKDQRGGASQGGYSDRSIRRIKTRRNATSYDVTRGPGVPVYPSP